VKGLPQWVKGRTSRQAHVALPPGTVEEEHGRLGFYGAASHLYRLHAPTGWTKVEGPAAHHALDCTRLEPPDMLWPTALLYNGDIRIGYQRYAVGRQEFLRNADGDELYFVHMGSGVLRTEYGPLHYRPGDYLLLPRGTTYRFEIDSSTEALYVHALSGLFDLPDRGLLGRHALFDPAMLEVPEPEAVETDGEFTIAVKRMGETTFVTYPFHPCDVIGWKGDLAPMRLNVADFRPVASPRYHLPPSAHSTFAGEGFVVCTFAPRPGEEDPEALKLPFYHRNIDFDEVIFYHRGDFMSRSGIAEGMITFHPHGLHHGPQPKAVERAAAAPPGPRQLQEYAVMIDARRPLLVSDEALGIDVAGYAMSWASE
jgi:homogentisate 1,2-dioxygenase